MQKYLEQYNPAAALANAAFEVVGSGDPSEGLPGIEGAFETHLDTQAFLGLAWPAQGILYNLGGVFGPKPGVTYDPFVRFLQDLIHNETVPSVVSFSESMPEDEVDPAYARSVCDMMAQVGTRGVTLVFSSGNNGPQGDQPTGTHKAIFEPEFPASCPYVLAVGGTTNLVDETAATQSTITGAIAKLSYTASGGGFSNLFPFPDYQQPDQPIYMRDHVPVSYRSLSGYSSNGRGIPDVSAFSTNFPVVYNGATVPISGTSAAAPTWAAVIALLNDYEASKCRPPLGFVNPWLYKYASSGILKDITTGGNNSGNCDQTSGCSLSQTPGYDVTPGWDAVTGLGSPIVSAMIEILDRQPC
ncbi:Peptidase S8/S53 [Teratosphaeria destructans]|uniref:Peptidase S8/S53 n=1 Tax=Teratosphaeria destructans TaxID=418781 RepID=A0A9W7W1C6_9PEZI|nr:Peptidase S8/S53 [Teratosphaeria destructans]